MTFKEGDKVICKRIVQDSSTVMNKVGIVYSIHNSNHDEIDKLLYVKFNMEFDDEWEDYSNDFTFGWNIRSSALELYKPDPLIDSMMEAINHD